MPPCLYCHSAHESSSRAQEAHAPQACSGVFCPPHLPPAAWAQDGVPLEQHIRRAARCRVRFSCACSALPVTQRQPKHGRVREFPETRCMHHSCGAAETQLWHKSVSHVHMPCNTSESQTFGRSTSSAPSQARRGPGTEAHARAPAAVGRPRDMHWPAPARAPAPAKLPSIQATGSFVDGGLQQRYEAALDKAVVARQHGGSTFIRAVRSPELFSEARLLLAAPLHLPAPCDAGMMCFPSRALNNSQGDFMLGSSCWGRQTCWRTAGVPATAERRALHGHPQHLLGGPRHGRGGGGRPRDLAAAVPRGLARPGRLRRGAPAASVHQGPVRLSRLNGWARWQHMCAAPALAECGCLLLSNGVGLHEQRV